MVIGDRLRELREERKLSQAEIEKRIGLHRCFVSRRENGHTRPTIDTLEKMAHALEVPLYQLFYDGENPPELPNLPQRKIADDLTWGVTGNDARWIARFRRLLSQINEVDRKLLISMVQKMARTKAD